jgi:hypothetical protein
VSKPTIRTDIAYFVAVMVVAGRSKLGRKVSFFSGPELLTMNREPRTSPVNRHTNYNAGSPTRCCTNV